MDCLSDQQQFVSDLGLPDVVDIALKGYDIIAKGIANQSCQGIAQRIQISAVSDPIGIGVRFVDEGLYRHVSFFIGDELAVSEFHRLVEEGIETHLFFVHFHLYHHSRYCPP